MRPAIHHPVEAQAQYVRAADEAYEITGDTPVAAHLDMAQIIAIAQEADVDAIHPGYGFLSENAVFAAAVTDAGMTFIGPDAKTISLMGDKISARNFAEANGVAVAPSMMPTSDLDSFIAEAGAIGFPLLIKAAGGGGGKGMNIVRDAASLPEAARLATSEAQRYFGDGRVYAETYVERPRHIEVQVLGDGEGGAIHLYERECSIQRRFQKIIKEAPAPNLDPELRREICDSAVRLAAAAKYRNAGTVEYILGADGRFFFLEMNTRLQVEHPVTEMITGLDLVRAQIEIAADKGLPLPQDQVQLHGHAIECRICAEDPDRDFMSETGTIQYLKVPEARHAYLQHDMQRSAAFFGLPYVHPQLPVSTHLAARVFHCATRQDPEHGKQLARRIFTAFFTERVDIRDEAEILRLAGEVGFDAQWTQDAIKGAQGRALLEGEVTQAIAAGVIGSPYFMVDGEGFFGVDRLPQLRSHLSGKQT